MNGTQRLARYSRKAAVSNAQIAPDTGAVNDKEPYVAYKLSKGERRYLEIREKYPDPAEAQSYAMLTSITGEWRYGLAITLCYGKTMVVKLRGERLTELFKALQEWRVEFIQAFDAERHALPFDAEAALIESIEIVTERPEATPPKEQRH